MKRKIEFFKIFFILILSSSFLYAHLCDNVFRQADSLIVKPETYSLVVKDKTTFKIFLQNNMDRGIAEISLIPESSAFDFEVTPKKMSIPKGRQVYFEVTIYPKPEIKTGNYSIKFKLVGGGREFKSFTLGSTMEEKKETQIDISKLPNIKPIETPPVIDGLFGDEAWKKATVLSNFTSTKGSEAIYKTWTLLTYDRNNLYIGIYCRDENLQNLTSDDKVEIILSPSGNGSGYVLSFSPVGNPVYKKYDKTKQVSEWNPYGIKYAVNKVQNYWGIEISLPFSSMNISSPKEKEIWSIRITRFKTSGIQETSFWAMDITGYHSEKNLGKIVLNP
ncbi:MAG TPA: sugar-binding protein [bacterium]|nr:sugar-binding protein [bacterium]HOM26760.1 sugar-binding protein [bacterium]